MVSRIFAVASVLAAMSGVASADVVYENLSTPLGNYLGAFAHEEAADQVVLAPGPRVLQSVSVAYAGFNFDGDEHLTVTLYRMDGAPTPGSFGFSTPGTVLFSTTAPIAATNGSTLTFLDNTGIVLSDVVAVGLAFSGVEFDPTGTAADAGPLLYDPPTIGSSADDYWLRGFPSSGDDWGIYTFGGSPPINFGVEIVTAAPEPATLALLGLGLAGLGAMRRRHTA